jgi:predicted nucleic acid-binding protein
MALIDTNYIIRYLLHDIDEQYNEAEAVIISQELTLLPEVLMECIHVLEKLYKISREAARYHSRLQYNPGQQAYLFKSSGILSFIIHQLCGWIIIFDITGNRANSIFL